MIADSRVRVSFSSFRSRLAALLRARALGRFRLAMIDAADPRVARQIAQKRHALEQCALEIELAVHRPGRDRADMIAHARHLGQLVDAFLLDHGAVHVGQQHLLAPSLVGDEVHVRLRAQLRQHEQSEGAVFAIGPYSFHPAQKILADGEARKVRLTEKETEILKYLYRAGDNVVSRDTLLGEVWGYNAGVATHTLEPHVYRLRQKIEADPPNARLLVTEPGGYRLMP